MDNFLMSLPKKGLYYFDKIDTSRINIVYTYKKINFFQSFIRKINLFLIKMKISFLNNLSCRICYDKKIVDAIKNDSGLAILDFYVGSELLYMVKKNKCQNFFLLIWNSISDYRANKYLKYLGKERIYSYSEEECVKFGFTHFKDFYLVDYPHENVEVKYDMFYLGANKNRADFLKKFLGLIKGKYTFEFDVYSKEPVTDDGSGITYFNKYISFDEYIDRVLKCRCLIDFNNHHNITFRTIESLIFNKKYITNNLEMKKMDFYNENNILIIDDNITINDIENFMNKKYEPVSRDILNGYDIYHTYEFFKSKVMSKEMKKQIMNEESIQTVETEETATPSIEDKTSHFDKGRAKKNVAVSILFKVLILALSLLAKRFLIHYGSDAYNGLNTLFNSILSFLAIADLGIGSAIVFCMYEPIANNDISKVRQLYTLFKKIYIVIGLIVLGAGLAIIPLLQFLVKDYTPDSTLYIGYALSLVGTVITYFYSAKMSLINAYKNNYISTAFTSLGIVLQYVLQIILLVITRNFIIYCACKIAGSALQILIFSIYNKHNNITKFKEKIDEETKHKVTKNVKAMFMHKIGDVIFNTVDSIVISAIISVVVLGYYSNYLLILTSMNEVLKLFIIPLTSVIGHMGVKASNGEKNSYFRFFYGINFILGTVFYLGYFAVCTDLVTIFFGEGLAMDSSIIIVLTITYFIQFMRQSASVFKDSFGLFYKDRWLALIASIVNAGLSVALAFWQGIFGVLAATIIVDIFMYHIVEPYVLFKYGFDKKPITYYLMNYGAILFFVGEVLLFNLVKINISNIYLHFLVVGSLSLAFNIVPVGITLFNKDFRNRAFAKFKR